MAVFNSGDYRNSATSCIHTDLHWDHKHPSDSRGTAREYITSGYETITLELVTIELHENVEDGYFKVTDKHRKLWVGKKVPLARGVMGVYPDTEGYVVYEVSGI